MVHEPLISAMNGSGCSYPTSTNFNLCIVDNVTLDHLHIPSSPHLFRLSLQFAGLTPVHTIRFGKKTKERKIDDILYLHYIFSFVKRRRTKSCFFPEFLPCTCLSSSNWMLGRYLPSCLVKII